MEEKEFENWLSFVRNKGLAGPYSAFGNAHQMGTCRIGTDKNASAVDVSGRVWGVKNSWICDASVFPSASGVNPMATVTAIAHWIADRAYVEMVGTVKKSAML
jgi:choline dehydrogenase-like flavoprotein